MQERLSAKALAQLASWNKTRLSRGDKVFLNVTLNTRFTLVCCASFRLMVIEVDCGQQFFIRVRVMSVMLSFSALYKQPCIYWDFSCLI